MARDPRKLYRFALYGRSGSGKSCFLGVMAWKGISSNNLTCERMPVELPEPSHLSQPPEPTAAKQHSMPATRIHQAQQRQANDESEALSLHKGSRWLNQIIEKIRNKDVPEPNPAVFEPPPPTVDFKVGDPQRGNFLVRLIDYSGELLNPDLEHAPDSFVAKLKSCLAESDGFLVLAEVPRRQSDKAAGAPDAPEALIRLRQAFQSLQESKSDALRTPIAVVFTKWDRYSQIDFDQPEKELQELKDFLDKHSQFRDLCNSISNALVEQERDLQAFWQQTSTAAENENSISSPQVAGIRTDGRRAFGLQHGNCRVFPASAFGQFRQVDGRELPTGDVLPFGILEPLVWLADRRDQLDVADLYRQWALLRPWAWLPFAWLCRKIGTLRRQTKSLVHRVARQTPPGEMLARLRRKLRIATTISVLASLFVFFGAVDTPFGLVNKTQFQRQVAILENPATSIDGLAQTRDYFDRYKQRPYRGILFSPGRKDASKQLDRIDELLDQRLWAAVQQASSESEKVAPADEYLRVLPSGPHAPDCEAIVQPFKRKLKNQATINEWETKLDQTTDVSALNDLAQQISVPNLPHPDVVDNAQRERIERLQESCKSRRDALLEEENDKWLRQVEAEARSADTVQKLAEVEKKLNRGFPHPLQVTPPQMEKLKSLKATINQKQDSIAWAEVQQEYRAAMEATNWGEAAATLLKSPIRDSRWEELVRRFPSEVLEGVSREVARKSQDGDYVEALDKVKEAKGVLRDVEWGLRGRYPALADKLLEPQRRLEAYRELVREQHDQHLYNRVRERRTEKACQEYLNSAPLGTMRSHVEKYKNYSVALEKPLTVTLSLRILWDKNYAPDPGGQGENCVTVYLDDESVSDSKEPVAEEPGKLSDEICRVKISDKHARDNVRLRVEIEERDNYWHDDGGKGESEFTLKELREPRHIPLSSQDWPNIQNRAVFKIVEGWPAEPELPPWKNR